MFWLQANAPEVKGQYCLNVDRETVQIILKHLDPEGVDSRSRRRLSRRKYLAKGLTIFGKLMAIIN